MTRSASEKRLFTVITDRQLTLEIQEALKEDVFQLVGEAWIKPNLAAIAPSSEIAEMLIKALVHHDELRPYYITHLEVLRQPKNLEDVKLMSDMERILHPTKTADAHLPAVLIPIDHTWMSMWLDEELASATLFGADRHGLLIERESITARPNEAVYPRRGEYCGM